MPGWLSLGCHPISLNFAQQAWRAAITTGRLFVVQRCYGGGGWACVCAFDRLFLIVVHLFIRKPEIKTGRVSKRD